MNIVEVKQAVCNVLSQMRERPIPVGISNRHLHLSQRDYDCLFPNQAMSVRNELKQPGQYAADQTVTLVGPKGKLEKVRILGPVRSSTQVEISKTDARTLGIAAPIRLSGDLNDTPGIKLVSEMGEVNLTKGVIVALRHIHMSPLDALLFGVKHGDSVSVAIEGTPRGTVFEEVSIRVSPDMVLEMHLDTDEANAADADNPQAFAKILKVSS
ncbi:MAG: phosphate propanoyltransferase [Vibrio sp.]|uniref:phosphate propanoyltransferase n=1 Tax=Vibrio sp. TaxID=678 RepID=UPI003A8A37BB